MLPTVYLNYLTESNLLTAKQFGLRFKLLTEVALAHVWHRVLEKLDEYSAQYIDTASSDESSSHHKLATIAGFMISVSLAEGPILRIFTRKMCLTIESRPGWNHTFRYPAALLEELKFWYSNIHSFDGYSLRLPPVTSTVIFSSS